MFEQEIHSLPPPNLSAWTTPKKARVSLIALATFQNAVSQEANRRKRKTKTTDQIHIVPTWLLKKQQLACDGLEYGRRSLFSQAKVG